MRLTFIAILIVIISIAVSAQNTVYVTVRAQDTVKISASFANSDLSLDDIQGVQGEVDVKIVRSGYFRLGGAFHYIRPCFDCQPRVDTYSAGPSLSYDVFNDRISLFGRALFGVTTDYNGTNTFTRTYGFGADVNVGHVFVRPFVLDFQRFEGVPVTVNRYGAGVGLRF